MKYDPNALRVEDAPYSKSKGICFKISRQHVCRGDPYWVSDGKKHSARNIIALRDEKGDSLNIFYVGNSKAKIDSFENDIRKRNAEKKTLLEVMLATLYFSGARTTENF